MARNIGRSIKEKFQRQYGLAPSPLSKLKYKLRKEIERSSNQSEGHAKSVDKWIKQGRTDLASDDLNNSRIEKARADGLRAALALVLEYELDIK